MKIKQSEVFLGTFFSFIYLILSLYWSNRIEIGGDTLEYYYTFLNIFNTPFPWDLEYFTSGLMYICKLFGADFRDYLFVNYILWLPLVYYIFSKSRRDIFFFCIGLFFLSYLFFVNVSFLIRQFNAILFFIYLILVVNYRIRFLFIFLMLISHLSSLFVIFFYFKKLSENILKYKKIIFLFFISLLFFDLSNILSLIVDFSSNIAGLDRKILAISSYVDKDYLVRPIFVFMNIIVVLIVVFSKKFYPTCKMSRVFAFITISSMLYILLRNEPILANRVAFVSYSFIIPILFLVLREFYVKSK